MLERLRRRVAAGTVAGAVLLADPDGWWRFAPLKWAVITTGCVVVAALTVAADGLRKPGRLGWLLLAWLVWLGVCSALGDDPRYAWIGTPERNAGWLMWVLCAAMLLCAVPWQAVVDGLIIAGCGLAPWLLSDALGAAWIDVGTERLTGPFGSAAYLGAACTLIAPATAGAAFDAARSRRWRAAAAVAAASAGFGIVGSGARAAWVAAVAVGAALVIRHRHTAQVRLVALGAAAVIALAVATTPVVDRTASTFDRAATGGASRLDEWRVGLRTARQHPLVGVGPEGYRIAFSDGVDVDYERAHGRDPQPDRAHSAPLDIALIAGLPGLALWVAILAVAGLAAARNRQRIPGPGAAGAIAALATYHVQQLFLFPLAELEPLAWMLAGGVVFHHAPMWPVTQRIRDAATAGCIVLACGAAILGALDVIADRYALRALRNNDVAAARTATQLRPDRLRLYLLDASLRDNALQRVGVIDDGMRWSPNDPIAERRRAQYLAESDPRAAVAVIGQLLAGDPLNGSLQVMYGTALARTDDLASAEQAWLGAADLAPDDPTPLSNLLSLYEQQGRADDAEAIRRRLSEIGNP
jgi:O-antigen ligase